MKTPVWQDEKTLIGYEGPGYAAGLGEKAG